MQKRECATAAAYREQCIKTDSKLKQQNEVTWTSTPSVKFSVSIAWKTYLSEWMHSTRKMIWFFEFDK